MQHTTHDTWSHCKITAPWDAKNATVHFCRIAVPAELEGLSVGLFHNKPADSADASAETVYYSTPFGETKDGQQKLFILGRDGVPFYPVFRSRESATAFFEQMNRAGYLLIEGTVESVQNTLRTIEPLKNAGIVIDPFGGHPVEIAPHS